MKEENEEKGLENQKLVASVAHISLKVGLDKNISVIMDKKVSQLS